MANPFDNVPRTQGAIADPFAESRPKAGPSEIFAEATESAKESIFAEAAQIGEVASSLARQAQAAKKHGDASWLQSLRESAKRLGAMLLEFIKKAVELAIFRGLLELCAMAMNAVVEALTKRGNRGFDVATPGIHVTPRSPAGSNYPPAGAYVRGASPYDMRAAAASPW